jgi:hypothetical protein
MPINSQKPTWPNDGQMKSWILCYLKCLRASETPVEAAGKAESSLEQLAGIGYETQSLRLLDEFLEQLPKDEVKQFLRLAMLGASISLDLPNSRKYEQVLKLIETRAGVAAPAKAKMLK